MNSDILQARAAELEIADKRRMVALDLVKTWSFALTTTAFLAPLVRHEAATLAGHLIIVICLTIQGLLVWFAKWVR